MQLPSITHPVLSEAYTLYPRSAWTRRRQCWRLRAIATAPLDAIRNTANDPWSRVMVDGVWHPVFTPNDVWVDAWREYERRLDLYERLVPLARWGI